MAESTFGHDFLQKINNIEYLKPVFEEELVYRDIGKNHKNTEVPLISLIYAAQNNKFTNTFSPYSAQALFNLIERGIKEFGNQANFQSRLYEIRNDNTDKITSFAFECYVALDYVQNGYVIKWTDDKKNIDLTGYHSGRSIAVECKSRYFTAYYKKLFSIINDIMTTFRRDFEKSTIANEWYLELYVADYQTIRDKVHYAIRKTLKSRVVREYLHKAFLFRSKKHAFEPLTFSPPIVRSPLIIMDLISELAPDPDGELPQFFTKFYPPRDHDVSAQDVTMARLEDIFSFSIRADKIFHPLYISKRLNDAYSQLPNDIKADEFHFHYWIRSNSSKKRMTDFAKQEIIDLGIPGKLARKVFLHELRYGQLFTKDSTIKDHVIEI